jgi:glutamate racemase
VANNAPIGVFDSGIGGLTVLRALIGELPGESFVYFGDTARVPYGNKSAETVCKFSRENVSFLMGEGVKIVVVACNTASAAAVPVLRDELPVPIVGVIEPGARAAVKKSKSYRIGVIGTAATIRSEAYQKAIRALSPRAEVIARACPLFVPLVEEGWADTQVAEMVAESYLGEFRRDGVDVLVLGCTHYPLLRDVIARVLGPSIELVDSAVETAREVRQRLEAERVLSSLKKGELSIYLSDITPNFRDIGERILGRPIPGVRLLPV